MGNNNQKENINLEDNSKLEEVVQEETEVEEVTQEETPVEKVEEIYTGKKAKISTKYDFKTMKYFHVYNNLYRRKMQYIYMIFSIVVLGFTAYITYTSIKDAKELSVSTFIIPGIMLLIASYIIYQGFTIESSLDKRLTMIFMKQKVSELYFEIREDKVIITPLTKPDDTFSYDWIQVTSIAELPQYYFFYSGKAPMFIIEKDPNAMIEGSYETIEEIIKEQITKKPYQHIDKDIIKKPINFVYPNFDINEADYIESEVVEENNEEETKEVNTEVQDDKSENDSQN